MTTWLLLHGFTGTPGSLDELCSRLMADASLKCEGDTDRAPGVNKIVREALPGHAGRGVDVTHTFENAVDDLVRRLEQLEPPIRVVGYSMGARLVLGALLRPEARRRITSATLIGAHFGLESQEARHARVTRDEAWAAMLEKFGLDAFIEAWARQDLFASQAKLPRAVQEAQAAERRKHRPNDLAMALRQLGLGRMPNYWPQLPSLDLPVLLIVGQLDAKFLGVASRAQACLPNAELVAIPGRGHNVVLEAPEHVASILRRDLT
ncbi:MAG: alpha/beta fold hydrolase [Deltaproteobacteria bacterium]|nr:alpha/beta fold hydrolase [Deltaproteobacteria bacterium]